MLIIIVCYTSNKNINNNNKNRALLTSHRILKQKQKFIISQNTSNSYIYYFKNNRNINYNN